MKILIDARMYGPKIAKGLGRYIQQIIDGLKEQDDKNDYVILLSKENWDEFEETDRFKKVLAPWRWYTFAEQIYLPKLIRKYKPDLVHFPHFNIPIFFRGKFIITIHDLILRKFPSRRGSTLNPIFYFIRSLGYRLAVYLAIRRAKRIITVSEFSKKEILNYYKINSEKVKVIHNGLTKLPNFDGEKSNDKEVLLRYNIDKQFLLYVGNVYPHKNLEKLLEAFKNLSGQPVQLVLVGKKDYFYNRLAKVAKSLGLNTNSVLFLDYVSDDDLAVLYRQAALYVFPSLYEGFGLPPLEAMQYSLPVVVSDVESLREVCGQAAEYFDPKSSADIAEKIKFVLNNQSRQEELRQLGKEQIKKFSWRDSVAEHLNIYNAQEKNN